MQVCTPSRDHKKERKRGESFLRAPSFRRWSSFHRVFLQPALPRDAETAMERSWHLWSLDLFMPQARDPTTSSLDVFPPRTFFHASLFCAICPCLVLLLGRFMNIFVNLVFHLFQVYLLQKYCSLVKEDSVKMRDTERYWEILLHVFVSWFLYIVFFFKLIISWWLLKEYCSLWMYISTIHENFTLYLFFYIDFQCFLFFMIFYLFLIFQILN